MMTANMLAVEFKPFGVKLVIRPTADRHGNIQTEIEAEASKVDDAIRIQINGVSIPGFAPAASRPTSPSATARPS
jgi:pilus assembly protein CpaC